MQTIHWIIVGVIAGMVYLNLGVYLRYAKWSLKFMSGPDDTGIDWQIFDPNKGLVEDGWGAASVRLAWPMALLLAVLLWTLWLTFGGGLAKIVLRKYPS